MLYVFGEYVLDTGRRELRQAGVVLPLEPKAYQVLLYLVEQHNRLVTKSELLEHVWPGVYVDDSAVARCILAVRKAVGDSAEGQRVIQTRRGQGYCFTAPVQMRPEDAAPTGAQPAATALPASKPRDAGAPEVSLLKLLDKRQTNALLKVCLETTPALVAGWVVDHDGRCVAWHPQPASDAVQASIVQLVQTRRQVCLGSYVGVPLIVQDTFRGGVLVQGQGDGPLAPEVLPVLHCLCAALRQCIALGIEKREILLDALEKYRELSLLYTIAEAIGSALGVEQIARLILDTSRKIIRAENSSVMLLNPATGALDIVAACGVEHPRKAVLARGRGIAGLVVQTGEPEIVNQTQTDPRFVHYTGMVRALLCVPLKLEDKMLGVINVSNPLSGHMFTARDAKLLLTLASQAAVAIENARLVAELTAKNTALEAALRQFQASPCPPLAPETSPRA